MPSWDECPQLCRTATFVCGRAWLAAVLLRISAAVFLRGAGLYFFLMMSLVLVSGQYLPHSMSGKVFLPLSSCGIVCEGLVLIFLALGRIHQGNHLGLDFSLFSRCLLDMRVQVFCCCASWLWGSGSVQEPPVGRALCACARPWRQRVCFSRCLCAAGLLTAAAARVAVLVYSLFQFQPFFFFSDLCLVCPFF